MSIRQAIITAVVSGLVVIGTALYGQQFFLWYLAIMGGLGTLATLLYIRNRRRRDRELGMLDEATQDDLLVAIENSAERPGLAEALGRPLPFVPIRGEREVFHYPREHVRVIKAVMYGCIFLAGFFGIGWLSDVVLGRTRFVDPATTHWWEVVLLIGGFSFGGLIMWWMMQATAGQLEISDEGVTYRLSPGRLRTVLWEELTEAGISAMSDVLWVRSSRTKIAVSSGLVGFGRAVNLVASRASARSKWRIR